MAFKETLGHVVGSPSWQLITVPNIFIIGLMTLIFFQLTMIGSMVFSKFHLYRATGSIVSPTQAQPLSTVNGIGEVAV